MEKKLIDYSVLAVKFVEGIFETNNTQDIESTIRETQEFILDILEDIVYNLEPIEDFENAHLSMKIVESLYIPIVLYKKNISHQKAEQEVKKQIAEVMESFRRQRDEQNNENNTNFEYDN
jgi:hypothetical protein